MSSLRAIVVPPAPTERLQPIASPTESYWPTPNARRPPRWAEVGEHTIRVVARLGFSPTPTILLVSSLIVAGSLHR